MSTETTRAARLDAILAKTCPKTLEAFRRSGDWPKPANHPSTAKFERLIDGAWLRDKTITAADAAASPDTIRPARLGAAPYVIATLADGGRKVTVVDDEGDVAVVGKGETLSAALTAIEQRLGLAPTESE